MLKNAHKVRKFSFVLYAHSQFLSRLARFDLSNEGVRQPVQSHTYARLLVFDETLSQPDFAVVNCSDTMMSVYYYPVWTRSLIFLQLWTAVSQRWVYFSPTC